MKSISRVVSIKETLMIWPAKLQIVKWLNNKSFLIVPVSRREDLYQCTWHDNITSMVTYDKKNLGLDASAIYARHFVCKTTKLLIDLKYAI